ncbi:MAG: hypothetical protein ACI86H_002754, partial [bacterium]
RRMGFTVITKLDASKSILEQAIQRFGRQLKKGGTGLFYYAGHGVQLNGYNYLVPVNANIESESEITSKAVNANEILKQMKKAKNSMNIVILDACRNNPFSDGVKLGQKGLAEMDAGRGTLIAYATAPGSTASDGKGRNGMFTKYLLRHIPRKGLELSQLMKKVRYDVIQNSKNRQIPWDSSSLVKDFYFSGGIAGKYSDERSLWLDVKNSRDWKDFLLFLKEYPKGKYARMAKFKYFTLRRKPYRATATNSHCAKIQEGSCTDWNEYMVYAVGIGGASTNFPPPVRKRAAMRAAKMVAQRNILEAVKKIRLNSTTTVRQGVVQSDVIRTSLSGYVRNVQLIGEPKYADGFVTVVMRMSLNEIKNAFLGLENFGQKEFHQTKMLSPSKTTKRSLIKTDQIYTGIIIDARNTDVIPAVAPKIFDDAGVTFYSEAFVKKNAAFSRGMVSYTRSMLAAKKNVRVKGRPITIKAVTSTGKNQTNLVISTQDANLLRMISKQQNFLKEARVVILLPKKN